MNRIKELVDECGKTLKEISLTLDMGYSTLSNYYQGIRQPKKNNAEKLADYFEVSVPYLMGLSDYKSEEELKKDAPPFWGDGIKRADYDTQYYGTVLRDIAELLSYEKITDNEKLAYYIENVLNIYTTLKHYGKGLDEFEKILESYSKIIDAAQMLVIKDGAFVPADDSEADEIFYKELGKINKNILNSYNEIRK